MLIAYCLIWNRKCRKCGGVSFPVFLLVVVLQVCSAHRVSSDCLVGLELCLPFHADMEITMEANPGTVEAQKFKDFF